MVTFFVPTGPRNLQALFPGIDFSAVEEYYVELKEQASAATVATTPMHVKSCCCNEDTVRLFFVNSLGAIDAIDMQLRREETEVKSSQWQKPVAFPLQKWDGGSQRTAIRANETLRLETACYTERDQEWLKELLQTPNAWLQWKGTQGQEDQYLAVVVGDGRFVTRKEEERYTYVLELEVTMSNENQTLRN